MAEQRKGDHKDPEIGNDDVLRQLTSNHDGDNLFLKDDRNGFFCVAPFDVVHGADHIVESSYGGGNRAVGVSNDSTSHGVVVSPILEVQERPAVGLANVGITSSDVTDERQEHEMGSNGKEDLVNDGWWENWLSCFRCGN
ncbi:hypothetical protein CTI12_AA233410 [Artemisia annua]|uniref:Uncharacterized protein n=1 Tax=Artemisia annua TaxID=35608 RepID=A0A2U1NSX3_ARTAN|nr:hypothetical protein CTI12_AA233410 [Artemisia annua]